MNVNKGIELEIDAIPAHNYIYCLPYSSLIDLYIGGELVANMDPGQYGQTCNLTNWKIEFVS